MKKIVSGCMAALLICSGAMAETRSPGELRAQIDAAKTGAAPVQQAENFITPEAEITFADIPEAGDSFMVPEAAANTTEALADNSETDAPQQAENFMVPEAAANETMTESSQGRKPGDLMGSIQAGGSVSFAQQEQTSIGIIGGADGPTEIIVSGPSTSEMEAPAAGSVLPETAEAETSGRKPGDLMGSIQAGNSVSFARQEQTSIGIISGADGPTEIIVSGPSTSETEAPAAGSVLPETAEAETSGRKPGDLMGSIQAGSSVNFAQQEQEAIENIGGQDGPTVIMTATPEETTAAEEPVAAEEPAETDVVGCPTEEIFVLRDSITWASTKDEVIASFDADVNVEEGIDDDMTVKTEYVNAWTVPVSSFEGEMYCCFHEGQLWSMIYWIDLEEADLKRLIAALDSKYGANVPGGEVYESILGLMAPDFYDDYEDYMSGDFYNWTGPENTQIVLMRKEEVCGLYYINGNYIPTLREAVASRAASLFGI